MRGLVLFLKGEFVLSRGFQLGSEGGQCLFLLLDACQLALGLGDLFKHGFNAMERRRECIDYLKPLSEGAR